ncbi:hypothetical protein ZWY2020_043836 [Hordeum vulgare]|nr:hypothetical protein ZWY2020_043836 [Hordeum vulgare]
MIEIRPTPARERPRSRRDRRSEDRERNAVPVWEVKEERGCAPFPAFFSQGGTSRRSYEDTELWKIS